MDCVVLVLIPYIEVTLALDLKVTLDLALVLDLKVVLVLDLDIACVLRATLDILYSTYSLLFPSTSLSPLPLPSIPHTLGHCSPKYRCGPGAPPRLDL